MSAHVEGIEVFAAKPFGFVGVGSVFVGKKPGNVFWKVKCAVKVFEESDDG